MANILECVKEAGQICLFSVKIVITQNCWLISKYAGFKRKGDNVNKIINSEIQ